MTKKEEEIISEIKRIAEKLNKDSLSLREFEFNSKKSLSVVYNCFGSWNRAVEAAGLDQNVSFDEDKISDEDLMQEIIRLTKEIGKEPSDREMNAMGKFSVFPYRRIWGKYTKARDAAYEKYGFPKFDNKGNEIKQLKSKTKILKPILSKSKSKFELVTQKLEIIRNRQQKKVLFGEPIAFRGLRFAPINEIGVVYLFGMVSRELGFLIESVRTEYPDCEGKRCIDNKGDRWEHVLIEFEYKSSNFRKHGHNPDDCDLIVCWIHDWEGCPIEVLELKSVIENLQK